MQDTYQQLVGGNLLTDAEFWRGHQDVLRTAPASKQRVGFSTAMIGDVRPGSDASTDKVPVSRGSKQVWCHKMVKWNALAGHDCAEHAYANFLLCNGMQVTFKITKDTIQQIFSEKPHIKMAYQLHVPHNLEEKVFWERYLRYLVRRKVRLRQQKALAPFLSTSCWRRVQGAESLPTQQVLRAGTHEERCCCCRPR